MRNENTLKIITNNRPRPVITVSELTDKEKESFGSFSDEELTDLCFRYKGKVWFLYQFWPILQRYPKEFNRWDLKGSDLVIKFPKNDRKIIIVGTYLESKTIK